MKIIKLIIMVTLITCVVGGLVYYDYQLQFEKSEQAVALNETIEMVKIPTYQELNDFGLGHLLIGKDMGGKTAVFDKNGEIVAKINVPIDKTLSFYEGTWAAYCSDGRWGFLDGTGHVIKKPFADEVTAFNVNGYASFTDGKSAGIITPPQLELHKIEQVHSIGAFNDEGLALFAREKGGKQGIIKEDGTILKEPMFESKKPLTQQNLIIYQENGKEGLIDVTGDVVKEAFAESIGTFNQAGYAAFCEKGRCGIIDQKGKVVVKPFVEYIGQFNNNGYAPFKDKGKFGILNQKGEIFQEPFADEIGNLSRDNDAVFKDQNQRWGILHIKS